VAMCNDNFNKECEFCWPECYKKSTISVQYFGKDVPRAQKFNCSFHSTTCVNTALKDYKALRHILLVA
jgi:hypothetical protein